MDDLDRKILSLLAKNARMPVKEIAEQVALTSPAVSSRIHKLETDGIISGYTVVLNRPADRVYVDALISLSVTPSHRDELVELMQNSKEVLQCYHVTGAYTFLIKVSCGSMPQLEHLILQFQKLGTTSTQIIHDAREAEDNDYYMIFSPAEDGKFTAQYGYSASYPADDLNDEIQNMLLPLLDLPEGSYTDLAASLSAMMVQSYGVAIVKPAEGKTQEVVDAMDAYIQNQQQTMEHYLEDQYQIAASAKVATVPTGEVVMVCCENSDAVMNAIKTALAA